MSKQIQQVSVSECAKCNIFCFPWAGGNRSSLTPLYKALSKEPANIYCINYAFSSPTRRIDAVSDLVTLLAEEFTVWLSARSDQMCIPVVFFGYSYGGLLAYEVAGALRELILQVDKLVLCAVASPQFLTLKNQSEQGILCCCLSAFNIQFCYG